SVAEARSDPASVGSATLSTVASSPTASTPSVSPPSAHHFPAPAAPRPAIALMTLTAIRYFLQYRGYFHFRVSRNPESLPVCSTAAPWAIKACPAGGSGGLGRGGEAFPRGRGQGLGARPPPQDDAAPPPGP